MIEVEKKFILNQEQKALLLNGAEFVREQNFTDTYFDTADFALAKNDMWLRSRDGVWQLKIPVHHDGGKFDQQYQEIESEENIRQVFGIVPKGDFLQDISDFGYAPFCNLSTKRRKYLKNGFVLDLDEVSFEDFEYEIAEIELMIAEKEEMKEAIKKINTFAGKLGLKSASVRGKVYEYLKRKKPEHFSALVEAGVVIE
jgi:predicted adenylyl cyclase CyaB